MAESAKQMRAHWDEKITWWAASAYEEQPRGLLDSVMARLRRSVHARAVIALELLGRQLEGKVVLDVGCGNGHFLDGCLRQGARHVIGMDISPAAVELAREIAGRNGNADRSTFVVGKAGDGNLPEADIVTGFGLIDWLDAEECLRFFASLRGRKFMFSYSEMDGSFDELVHYVYLVQRLRWFGMGVRAYHHPRSVILNRLKKSGAGPAEVVSRKEMRFGRLVHNLGGG